MDIQQCIARIRDFSTQQERPLIVLLGPTASGKTKLSLDLAQQLGAEIVSADSRQVYRGMDIGTDKIRGAWQGETLMVNEIPHHLIDVADPDYLFTVAEYKERADKIITDILARKKIPLLVGGTMLYIDALTKNLQIPHVPPNEALRAELEAQANEVLYAKLKKMDPECAAAIDANNPRRLVRAVEFCMVTGLPFSAARTAGPEMYQSLLIGLDVPRTALYRRIDERVDAQIAAGLVDETKRLLERYGEVPPLLGLGYREIISYLRGERSLTDAVQRIKFDTHAYARRQLTWWRKDSRINWFSV